MALLSNVRVKARFLVSNINVWLSMMSGHGANPIFIIKKIKIGRPEHALTPHPLTSENILLLPYPLSLSLYLLTFEFDNIYATMRL